MSNEEKQEGVQIIGAGAEADIPESHRKALEGQQPQSAEKPFDKYTQREQCLILHSQVDALRTSFGWISESLIQQAGALQCAMGILKQLKPEWTITSVPVKDGLKWVVVDEAGQVVESIFPKQAEETRPVQDNHPENATAPGEKSE